MGNYRGGVALGPRVSGSSGFRIGAGLGFRDDLGWGFGFFRGLSP